jgi:D-alanyl-D-alanine carboxypeptidase
MTTWDRALYTGRLLPPRQQHQLESLVSEATGKPIRHTTAADPNGYGLGVQQVFNRQTGSFWAYEGQAFGARVIHYYFPRTGMLIAAAANSSTTNDHLNDLAGAIYQTLQRAGAIPAS